MRYEEDYSPLLKDSSRDLYHRFKCTRLSAGSQSYISFGGEARIEYDAFNNEDWGKQNLNHNNFLLQRYNLHADLHLGSRLRLFTQLRSALENGRKNGPRPIDEDHLNIQNLFVDVRLIQQTKQQLLLRAGRQELNYGAGRLISVREGPNVRLYFTGAKAIYTTGSLSADAFVMIADSMHTGVFDNKPTKEVNLWGTYATLNLPLQKHIDGYYIGVRRDNALFDKGVANERRHTIGTRLWKNNNGLIYDIEAAWQFGSFGTRHIRAWTTSFDIGYLFGNSKLKPLIAIRNDYISGDRGPGDPTLRTFNPLYPKGGYFGFDPQVGPVNLIDIHPYGSVVVANRLSIQWDVVFNWRYSTHDGAYRPSGTLNLTGAGSPSRYIGTGYLAKVIYTINPFFSIDFGAQYFTTGTFIKDQVPIPQNALLTNFRTSCKF